MTTSRRRSAIAGFALVAMQTTGCAGGAGKRTVPVTDDRVLTAYGALWLDWNQAHVPVVTPTCNPGMAYDPDPNLWSDGDCPGVKHLAVEGRARVAIFQVNLPRGASETDAIAAGRSELPPDARVVGQVRRHACVFTAYRSARLAALQSLDIPDGAVDEVAKITPDGYRFAILLPDETTIAGGPAPSC
jgi:hypothetical protein